MTRLEITSPCIRNCCLNEQDICVGCSRSLDEIKQWHNANLDEKKKILANAQQRKLGSRF